VVVYIGLLQNKHRSEVCEVLVLKTETETET